MRFCELACGGGTNGAALTSVRLFNWQVSLAILVVAIVLVIPLSYSLVLSNRSSAPGGESSSLFPYPISLLPPTPPFLVLPRSVLTLAQSR